MKRRLITTSFVLKTIISVFVLSVLFLGVMGFVIALSNDRVGIAIAVASLTSVVSVGALLAGNGILAKHDAEACEFRRYD